MRVISPIALALLTGPVAAETGLPAFPTCFAQAIAHFEMEFARAGTAAAVADFDIVTRDRVHHCGTLAIVACDRGEDPQACQRALAEDQTDLRDRVLASLPLPGDVPAAPVLPGLYPTLWDVAHGSSAGPDCAGAEDPVAAWCTTHEARLKLTEAVALWQVARLLGAAGPAADLGWVEIAMPYTPVPRPDQGDSP
jgi:hypothetical protein